MPEEVVNREALIDVFDTNDDSESMVVRGLLEASDIEVLLTSMESTAALFPFRNGPLGHMRLQVFESDAAEARQIIAQYRQAGQQEMDASAEAAE
jgi:hypothetical protein